MKADKLLERDEIPEQQQHANLVFNQSVLLALVCAIATFVAGFALSEAYLRTVAADAATVAMGKAYLWAYTPGLALQFALVTMGSALRGTGIAKPTMVVQMGVSLLLLRNEFRRKVPSVPTSPAIPVSA